MTSFTSVDSGWFYRYSHLQSFDASVKLGGQATRGAKLWHVGKEGGSGGWSHLHWDITMPQPSGRYGIADGYAFMFQAYLERCDPQLVAVARPHQVAWCGEPVTLDASRSWHAQAAEFSATTGSWATARPPPAQPSFAITPGPAIMPRWSRWPMTTAGQTSMLPSSRCSTERLPCPGPPAFTPPAGRHWALSLAMRSLSRFAPSACADEGEELWNFGDGTAVVRTRSDGNANQHAPDGYAITTHHFDRPGEVHHQCVPGQCPWRDGHRAAPSPGWDHGAQFKGLKDIERRRGRCTLRQV